MNNRFLFDVDGTLTTPKQKIDHDFEEFMINFCILNKVGIVTGNTKNETIAQLGEKIFSLIDYSFNCSGNECWSKQDLLYKNEWEAPIDLMEYLKKDLDLYDIKTKTGVIQLSLKVMSDNLRIQLRENISSKFPSVDVVLSGTKSLDIYPQKRGKEQVFPFLKEREKTIIYYFGDQIFENGNDYKIAKVCNYKYKVKNWTDTFEILKFLREVKYCE